MWRSFLVKLYFVCYKIIFALCTVLNIWSCIMYVKAHLKNLAKCLKVLKQLDFKMACFSDLKAKILKLFYFKLPLFLLKKRDKFRRKTILADKLEAISNIFSFQFSSLWWLWGKNSCSSRFFKIHKETSVPGSPFNKVARP